MDQELYSALKKGKPHTVEKLIQEHLARSWFLCQETTMDSAMAVPLLLSSWERALAACRGDTPPAAGSFLELLSGEVLAGYLDGVEPDGDWADLPEPQLPHKYRLCAQELRAVSPDRRPVYLAHTLGGSSIRALAEVIGSSYEEAEGLIKRAEREVIESHGSMDRTQRAALVRLFTEFKGPQSEAFQQMEVPQRLEDALRHQLQLRPGAVQRPAQKPARQPAAPKAAPKPGKEGKPGAKKPASAPAKPTVRKPARQPFPVGKVAAICVAVVVVAVLVVVLYQRLGMPAQAASITTYEVAAVSYGDVDTTISGSGTLSPVSQDTLTAAAPVTLTAVNYAAGDAVESGAALATGENELGETVGYTAPYDCVLLEVPAAAGDTLAAGEEVAMVMGKDGFTMGIAVDEQDIALIEVGQEASFTIDAIEDGEEVAGSISQVSYNGSSNGSATAYQITAKIAYVEGVYPGMSASAQIVVEESGEGLLVPMEAVQTSGDENYVYLAPSDGEEGAEYEEEDIDLSALTQVTVEAGDSDGSYMLVECDDLSEGDLILVPHLTSTATGSGSGDSGGMGGFGGSFPGGMDFSDFDFSNFDPSTMPQGGSFPGMGS